MSKWLSVRLVHLKEGEYEELDSDERVVSASQDHPHFWLTVVKESNRRPPRAALHRGLDDEATP